MHYLPVSIHSPQHKEIVSPCLYRQVDTKPRGTADKLNNGNGDEDGGGGCECGEVEDKLVVQIGRERM